LTFSDGLIIVESPSNRFEWKIDFCLIYRNQKYSSWRCG